MSPNLVFASGVLVPQRLATLDYFRGLPELYPPETALFAPVSALGSVELRAEELAEQIARKFPAGDIHIVAHSMGGLDARCLLARNLAGLAGGGRVVSLSTIATPHHGSPVADLVVAGLEFPFHKLFAEFINLSAHALVDLSTTGAPGFKERDPVPGVRYFAYAGAGPVSKPLSPTHDFIELREGGNDGMVSVSSATWPDQLAEAPWEADHLAEIGYDLTRADLTTTFPHLDAIARVVKRATS
jgi:triacylglycerol lipase